MPNLHKKLGFRSKSMTNLPPLLAQPSFSREANADLRETIKTQKKIIDTVNRET